MDQTLGDFLAITSAEDYIFLNVSKGRERVYYGYQNGVPEEVKSLKIAEIYIDWESEALGIQVK